MINQGIDTELIDDLAELDEHLDKLGATSYRAMSRLAVLSFTCGLFSILTAAYWKAGVIPAGGIILGWIALFRIAEHPNRFTGRALAWVGIGLSIGFWLVGYSWLYYLYRNEAPAGYLVISYDALHSAPGTPGSEIPQEAFDLEDRLVFVKGYMMPGRQQTNIKRFVLCRDNGVCSYCNPQPELTDLIEIELIHGLEIEYTTHLIGVGGKFKLKEEPQPGEIVFQIQGDVLRWAPE